MEESTSLEVEFRSSLRDVRELPFCQTPEQRRTLKGCHPFVFIASPKTPRCDLCHSKCSCKNLLFHQKTMLTSLKRDGPYAKTQSKHADRI